MSSMLDSYGASAISQTAYASRIAVSAASGANVFVPFVILCVLVGPFHSVINGSNVHSASTRNTTSIAVRMLSHIVASASSGGDAISAAVPRTPQMITGTVIGYNRIGSRTSRVRDRINMAPKSVPTDAKPTVPDASSATSSTGRAKSGDENRNAISGTSTASASASSVTMPSSLPT